MYLCSPFSFLFFSYSVLFSLVLSLSPFSLLLVASQRVPRLVFLLTSSFVFLLQFPHCLVSFRPLFAILHSRCIPRKSTHPPTHTYTFLYLCLYMHIKCTYLVRCGEQSRPTVFQPVPFTSFSTFYLLLFFLPLSSHSLFFCSCGRVHVRSD